MDIFGLGNTTPLKFLSILLLTLSVLDFREKTVTIALAFTAAADVFLLLLDRYYEAGILCFIAVQICYALRLQKETGGSFRPYLLSPLAGLAVCSIRGFGLTEALAAAYIALFAVNLVRAGILAGSRQERKWLLFAVGLALFFCCDLCVGLHNLPSLGSAGLHRFANVAMWGFYLPGQCLIRASAYPAVRKETVL